MSPGVESDSSRRVLVVETSPFGRIAEYLDADRLLPEPREVTPGVCAAAIDQDVILESKSLTRLGGRPGKGR